MPIYAYKCESCGFAKDVLQKMSDAPLSVCPHCSDSTFKKQLTAAGFQLKGSGWYVTDFRGGDKGAAAKPATPQETVSSDTGKSSPDAGTGSSASPAPAAPATAAPAPLTGSGTGSTGSGTSTKSP